MEIDNIKSFLFERLSFRSERQKVISSNIANINTPNYKTKDLEFESQLKQVSNSKDLQLNTTHKNHMKIADDEIIKNRSHIREVPNLEEQNDGNNVNLDKQMSEMAKNNMIFDAIQGSIKANSRLTKSIIEASAKN